MFSKNNMIHPWVDPYRPLNFLKIASKLQPVSCILVCAYGYTCTLPYIFPFMAYSLRKGPTWVEKQILVMHTTLKIINFPFERAFPQYHSHRHYILHNMD